MFIVIYVFWLLKLFIKGFGRSFSTTTTTYLIFLYFPLNAPFVLQKTMSNLHKAPDHPQHPLDPEGSLGSLEPKHTAPLEWEHGLFDCFDNCGLCGFPQDETRIRRTEH